MNKLPVFMTPLSSSFRCSACGDCCRAPWAINVEEGAARAIAEALRRRPHPWAMTVEQALVPLSDPTPDAVARLKKRVDGACVFLDSDNLCYLHKHFGPEVKPATCRTYPFRPVRRPGMVIAPGSLSCRTLRRRLAESAGAPAPGLVPAAAADLVALADLAYDRYSPGAYLKLGAGREIRVEALGQAEERLAALLCDGELSLPERLLGMRYLVDALVAAGPHIGSRAVALAAEAALGPGRGALRERAARLLPDAAGHLRLVGALVERMVPVSGPALRERQARQLGGTLNLPEAARAQVAACLYRARDTLDRPAHLHLLTTFLAERLRASNITMRYGLLATVQAQIIGAALVRAFACARAGEQGRAAARADVLAAIEEVDLLFFHNLGALELLADVGGELMGLAAAERLALPPAPAPLPAGVQVAEAAPLP